MTRLLAALALASFQDAAPKIGDAFPSLALKALDGKEIKLSDFVKSDKDKGKIVVVSFWSYGCPTGALTQPSMKELAEWCDKNGAVFVAVASFDEDTADGTKAYVEKNKIAYPVVFDEKAQLAKQLGAKQVNETYVVDAEGKLRYHGGLVAGKPKELKKIALDSARALADGKTIERAETKTVG